MDRRLSAATLCVALLAAAWSAGPGARAGEESVPSRSVAAAAVLDAFDRVINVEIANMPLRETFAELARAGGIRITVDPAVRGDLRVNGLLKGVALGDALTMVAVYAQLELIPGEHGIVVVPTPAVSIAQGFPLLPQPVQQNVNPWRAWYELGLPLVPGGRMGYPKKVAGPVACPRCGLPMQAFWVYCPRCGQQRTTGAAQGNYCWACGRPLKESPKKGTDAPANPGTTDRQHLGIIPLK